MMVRCSAVLMWRLKGLKVEGILEIFGNFISQPFPLPPLDSAPAYSPYG